MTNSPSGFRVIRTAADSPGAATLLLIHGFLDDAAVWDQFVDALDGEVATVRYDLPGFGTRHDTNSAALGVTLEALAAEAVDIVDHIDGSVIVVGQSLGTQIAELVAAQRKDRISGLVLLTPVPFGGTRLPVAVVAEFQAVGGNRSAQRQARAELSPHLDDEQLDRLAAMGAVVAPDVVAHYVNLWNTGAADAPAMSAFNGPVLIIRGNSDGFITEDLVRAIAARFAGADVHVIDRGGHWLHVEHPGAVAAMVLDFTDSVVAVAS
ncbi:alpha/beta hydrolase [Mycobacterium sp. CBMA 234]|uniref:alpha/beta fold hydrolase n=1 Tax=Mycolicibacterium sp. CBMA 234 TaxID=1918495 RepID=UPI0012DDFCB0|nr:alpha/beta fold hydrolase [Mycolicibacterium sp. CBMA 234]MUL67370.1 alpha/beta hydrolase [Mycolicibacterium sp. CBMA 234]